MDLQLRGAKAVVFGSSAGMGRAIATSLSGEGAAVFVTGRDNERVKGVAAEVGAAGSIVADTSIEGEAARVVDAAADVMGGLDILIGNSGGGRPGGMVGTTAQDVQGGFERMLRPQLEAMRAATPHLVESGDGRIVVLTARSILEASPDLALSSVFRSGVAAAARSLALELAPTVRVNVVVPGQVDSGALQRFEAALAEETGVSASELRQRHMDAIPMGRLADASEIGDLVTFLVSDRAAYVTGAVFRIDGGLTIGF
ncbi:MAG: SDR family NAD(P)-dependent oxidoreductase [Armatimonadetes bacterium]|nr:MAG: SDR family NAD(P)-dependent oxidoreductase [Armatimonadota bacterium]